LNSNFLIVLISTRIIKAPPIQRVTISFGNTEKPNAPSAVSGRAVAQNNPTDFQSICFIPNTMRARFPISWAIVSTGTATSAPTQAVTTGSSKRAPPKPAAPETNAAIKLERIRIK